MFGGFVRAMWEGTFLDVLGALRPAVMLNYGRVDDVCRRAWSLQDVGASSGGVEWQR